ncbi:MAG: hypothetical protein ACLSHU_08315 [Oscillospiraceae bacterium]
MIGRVVKSLSGFYEVQTEAGVVTCRAREPFPKGGPHPPHRGLGGDFLHRQPGYGGGNFAPQEPLSPACGGQFGRVGGVCRQCESRHGALPH